MSDNLRMYLGNERRNRLVALGLAAVLVAGVVLALLATVAAAKPAVVGVIAPGERPAASGVGGSVSGSSSNAPPAGHHDAVDSTQLASVTTGHPERLVGVVMGVALLLTCGVMVVHEQRRRRAEPRQAP